MHRQINVGCSREELHTSIEIPFFLFCCRCCVRGWVVSMDCRKGTGDHVSWKHIAVLHAVKWHQTIKADCLSHQILFAKVGESLSVFRRHYGGAASVIPYTLMHPLAFLWPHDGTSALGIRCRPACVSFLTARLHISTRNSLHANVFVFSDSTIAHQHSEFAARHRAGRVCRHDGTSAFVSRCPASCLFFLTARWRTLAQRQPKILVRCC